MIRHPLSILLVTAVVGLHAGPRVAADDAPVDQVLRSGSRPYVHRITLYDYEGAAIDPEDVPTVPYSPMKTCGKCHAYGQIRHGHHFNALDPQPESTRSGEPWIFSDSGSGTQLPLSARGWPGTFTPQEVGISDWAFVRHFGRHMPGGSFGDPDRERIDASDEMMRWDISGTLQIDCLFCHSADGAHDPAEASRQIERENFSWAPTAAAGLGVVRGDAKRVPDDFDPYAGPDPDRPELALPSIEYDTSRFDADNRVTFRLTRRPDPERCYACHTVRPVGETAPARWERGRDVHLAAGMICVDCHRNDISHDITRGDAGETARRGEARVEVYSCSGCHLGRGGSDEPEVALAGRYGAPRPEHAGIPEIHFERLTCTACHSGPWPRAYPQRVQTSLAHALGVPSKHRSDGDPPEIVEPIFARDADERIAPQRMLWPSYWGTRDGERIVPLPIEDIPGFAGARDSATEGAGPDDAGLDDSRILMMLGELASARPESIGPVYVRGGLVHSRAEDGALVASADAAAQPVLWPLAHDVRPASQSLGVRGCRDCHAEDAPIYFGKVQPADDAGQRTAPVRTMLELRGDDPALALAWARSFRYRTVFKWFGAGCLALIGLILLSYGLEGVRWITGRTRSSGL